MRPEEGPTKREQEEGKLDHKATPEDPCVTQMAPVCRVTCGNCLLVPGSAEEAAAPRLEAAEETCPSVFLGEDSHIAPRRTPQEVCGPWFRGYQGHLLCLCLVCSHSAQCLSISPVKWHRQEGEGSSAENSLDHISLWVCLWDIFLLADRCGRAQPTLSNWPWVIGGSN